MTPEALTAITERRGTSIATYKSHRLRVVVFGSSGLAGKAICRKFNELNRCEVYEIGHDACDAAKYADVCQVFAKLHRTPDVVINCIAHSAVDLKDNDDAFKSYVANSIVPFNIGTACIQFKVPLMIHISTDYVFNSHDGIKIKDDCQAYSPSNVYGQHKLAGDLSLVGIYDNWNFRNEDDPLKLRIVRTSSLYGPDRRTFVDYVVDEYLKNGKIKALTTGSSVPTSTRYLAEYIYDLSLEVLSKDDNILYHNRYFKNCVCSNDMGNISRFRLAATIEEHLRELEVPGSLVIEMARDCDFSALRPLYSQLEPSSPTAPGWKTELEKYLHKKLDTMGFLK